nr:PAS domain-containing sensor histidine kinase [bacterium]
AVYVIDKDSRIVFANQYFSDVLNIPRVFLLGEILSDIFDVELDKKLTAEISYTGMQNYEEAEIYSWKTLNEKRTFRISKKYIKTTKQIVYLAKDITREQELSAMKNNFINIASHQLRTPMTAIMLNSHILKDFYSDDETTSQPKELAETISRSAERMTRLIDDILNITKIQNESLYKANFEHTNMKDVVELVHHDVKDQLHSKNLLFSVKISKSLPVFKCDRSAVHEIISNLVTNAVQYTPDAGTITVSAKVDGKYIAITVKDTGIGVPAEAVSRIYDQFARADNAFEAFNEGTGLGLYLVKLLLMKIGGSIECDSKLNIGTAFTVKIPYIK